MELEVVEEVPLDVEVELPRLDWLNDQIYPLMRMLLDDALGRLDPDVALFEARRLDLKGAVMVALVANPEFPAQYFI